MVEIEARDRITILIHYYRAMVGRADVWRIRMDTTTNWAIGATAAVVSFTLGNAAAPHYVVFIASLLTLSFLHLEARRLCFYHLWQQRVLLLERGLIAPALRGGESGLATDPDLVRDLIPHLGRSAPTMSLAKAAARRLRRVYLYLFGVQLLAWGLKLSNHPLPAGSPGELIARAHIASVPGPFVVAIALLVLGAGVALAAAMGGRDRRSAAGSEPGEDAPAA